MQNDEGASKRLLRMESKWVEEESWALVKEFDENDREKVERVVRAVEGWNEGKFMVRIIPND
jgi:hypothetical protein